jgi:hypothetical protein
MSARIFWSRLVFCDFVVPETALTLWVSACSRHCVQLVDRMDNIFVGLLGWSDTEKVIQLSYDEWPQALKDYADTAPDVVVNLSNVEQERRTFKYMRAVLTGLTPRVIQNLRRAKDVKEVLRQSNPWPTLNQGPVTFDKLCQTHLDSDQHALLEFLIWAHDFGRGQLRASQGVTDDNSERSPRGILTGRILVDLTRLRDELVIVEVELIRAHSVLPGKALLFTNQDKKNHVHDPRKRGKGHTFVRTYVLHTQALGELGLWAVFAQYALLTKSTHCSYMSEDFLRATAGESQAGADERNRAAIRTAVMQYSTLCDNSVLVMPLSHARIQKAEDASSSLGSSSTIHAHEVWDMLSGGFRCNEQRDQLMVLVATEPWELDAVYASSTIAWPQTSEYRNHMQERLADELECEVCRRSFSTRTDREHYGCDHSDKLICPEPGKERDWKETSLLSRTELESETGEPEMLNRARWKCCGKPYFERECSNRRHTKPTKFEEAKSSQSNGIRHPMDTWWCNFCCSVVSEVGCQAPYQCQFCDCPEVYARPQKMLCPCGHMEEFHKPQY